jgi:ABC-2 type transport system ATP-binding protein
MIRTRNLQKTYLSRTGPVEAARGIDLDVEAGQIFGFLGPNGAGKTTTLRMLTTLIKPSAGEASVAGADLLKEPERIRERIGYVAQGGGSDPQESGRRELIIQARLYGLSKAEANARAKHLLGLFEIEPVADRKTDIYSGGTRRRLDIALGIIHKPLLLFLDEPTTGLDPQARARIWDEIRKLRDNGMTIFMTTHYLEEADALCDRLAIIDHGHIVAEGSPHALKREVAGDLVTIGVGGAASSVLALTRQQPFVREASITEDGGVRLYVEHSEATVPQLLRLLDGAGFAPESIVMSRPSLDDVFLRKTGRSLREAG